MVQYLKHNSFLLLYSHTHRTSPFLASPRLLPILGFAGTKPEHLHSILFEGLDPILSREGLFGRGTYFAEHPAKIDQYVAVDSKWAGSNPADSLFPLHRKLYSRHAHHPEGNVYYTLVCRVAVGEVVRTKNG